MKCKLHYLTVATIPSTSAHAKYVDKICNSFSELIETTVISARGSNSIHKNKFKLSAFPIPFKSSFRYRSYLVAIWHAAYLLIQVFKGRAKSDIFIVHNPLSALFCGILSCPYVIDLHAKDFGSGFSRRFLKQWPPIHWIVMSKALMLYLTDDLGVKESAILLSRNAVEEEISKKPITDFVRNHEALAISYIGRLSENTGIENLYQALNNEDGGGNALEVFMAGDQQKNISYLKGLDQAYPNSAKKINYVGFLNESEVAWLSENSDVLLILYSKQLPTIGISSPMKLFEYLTYNKLVIAPDIVDVSEVVNYYESQNKVIYYKMDDSESLNFAIKQACSSSHQVFKKTLVETWSEKAKNILNAIRLI